MKRDHSHDDVMPEHDFSNAERGRYAGRFFVDPATPPGTTVVLRRDLPDSGLREGDAGRLIGPGAGSDSLEVEFPAGSGHPVRLDLKPGDLRLLRENEVLHARSKTG